MKHFFHLAACWLVIGWSASNSIFLGAAQEVQDESAGSFDSLVSRAGEARQSGRLAEARTFYEMALKQNPSWAEGWWFLGALQYELESFSEGIDALKKVVEANPEASGPMALLGLCQFQQQLYDEAFQSLGKALRLGLQNDNPILHSVKYHYALLLSRGGRFEEALQQLTELAAAGEYSAAWLRESMGMAGLRLAFLPAELPAEHRQAVLIAGRAIGYMAISRTESASYEFKRLLRLFPQTPSAHYLYAGFLAQTDSSAALNEYLAELKVSPQHLPAHIEVAFDYLNRGEPAKALPFARKAVELGPDSFAAHHVLGLSLLDAGDLADAISELQVSVQLAPNSPESFFALAKALQKAGQDEAAAQARAESERLRSLRVQ